MTRIKNFYHDHKAQIVLGTAAIAATAVLIARHRQAAEDAVNKPIGASVWTNQSGATMLGVVMQDGTRFYLNPNQKAA